MAITTAISPGVYSSVSDFTAFVQVTPGTIGFVSFVSERGPDNELVYLTSPTDLRKIFGDPNKRKYGQGLYIAEQFLNVVGSMYVMRILPWSGMQVTVDPDTFDINSATMANVYMYWDDGNMEWAFDTQTVTVSKAVIEAYVGNDTNNVAASFLPIGRGGYYNNYSVSISANKGQDNTYRLDIKFYNVAEDSISIIESFLVAFDSDIKDSGGESMRIDNVVNKYSEHLNCIINESVINDNLTRLETTPPTETVVLADQTLGQFTGALTVIPVDTTTIAFNGDSVLVGDVDTDGLVYDTGTIAVPGAGGTEILISGTVDLVTGAVDVTFVTPPTAADIDATMQDLTDGGAFDAAISNSLQNGSDGIGALDEVADGKGLWNYKGVIDTTVQDALLAQSYAGTLDAQVLDKEMIYFSLAFDAGYSQDVKTSIGNLAKTLRGDLIAIIDNGDNVTAAAATAQRATGGITESHNDWHVAIYEGYTKVYDAWTGTDQWFSPTYHMARIIPFNDRVGEIWYAPAGYNRGTLDGVKELRYNPNQTERDNLYLAQLNPLLRLSPGYVVWGQLTSQRKASALQDINIVRLVLYLDRIFTNFTKFFVFEQNDTVTWKQVQNGIQATLEEVKQRRGLDAYELEVGATEYEKKQKTFHVNISLTPTRTVEKILLNFVVR